MSTIGARNKIFALIFVLTVMHTPPASAHQALQALPLPLQLIEQFLRPWRELLFSQANRYIKDERSPVHHVWNFTDQDGHTNQLDWTLNKTQEKDSCRILFTISAEQTQQSFPYVINYLQDPAACQRKALNLAELKTLALPAPNFAGQLHIRWPTPDEFHTRWHNNSATDWSMVWTAQHYGLDLAISRQENVVTYRCLQCWNNSGDMSQEGKVVLLNDFNARYYLDGEWVDPARFQRWLQGNVLFTLSESGKFYAHQFLRPALFH